MAKKKASFSTPDETTRLLKDLLIVQLGLAGVAQSEIRSIVESDMGRVNRIVKLLRNKDNPTKRTKTNIMKGQDETKSSE